MAGDRIDLADLLGRPAQLLLEVELGARPLRLTDGPACAVEDADGNLRRFDTGLEADTPERILSTLSGGWSDRSASVRCVCDRDFAAEVAAGAALVGARGELSAWYPGQKWEDRRRLLVGELDEPLVGARGEPLVFALVERIGQDGSQLLNPGQVVGPSTLPRTTRTPAYVGTPSRDPNVEGAFYPRIIGCPGHGVPLETAGTTYDTRLPGSPVLVVEWVPSTAVVGDHAWLVAGHPMDATHVRVQNTQNPIGGGGVRLAIQNGVDNAGQQFAYVQPSTSGECTATEGEPLFALFDPEDGGGTPNPYADGPLRRADHVVRWLLEQSDRRVDWRQLPRLALLRSFLLDGFVNSQTSAVDLLEAAILPLLPVAKVAGPDGIYVAALDWGAEAADAVVHLEEGRNAWRRGPVVVGSVDDVVNHVTVRFGVAAHTGVASMHRVVTGIRTTAEARDPLVVESMPCALSQQRWGVRRTVIDTPWVWDAATAELVALSHARWRSHPPERVQVDLPRSLDWLRPGDVATWTDDPMSNDQRVGWVEGLSPTPAGLVASVRLKPLIWRR